MSGPAVPPQAITAEMVEAAHDADIAGGKHGRYRRIIAAVWPHLAAAEREACAQLAEQEAEQRRYTPYGAIVSGALRDFAALLREEAGP